MKNILAENMMRFGVKNLSESDVKRIEESLLSEQTEPIQPYAQINPNSWKFKDQAALDAAFDPKNYPVSSINAADAAQGVYGPWAWQLIPNSGGRHQMNLRAGLTARQLAVSLAILMAAKGFYNSNNPSLVNFDKVIQDSKNMSNSIYNINNSFQTPGPSNGGLIGNQDFGIHTLPNKRGEAMNQKQWEATLQLIAPAINDVISKYVMPKQIPAATPKAAIPSTPAPVKKN